MRAWRCWAKVPWLEVDSSGGPLAQRLLYSWAGSRGIGTTIVNFNMAISRHGPYFYAYYVLHTQCSNGYPAEPMTASKLM